MNLLELNRKEMQLILRKITCILFFVGFFSIADLGQIRAGQNAEIFEKIPVERRAGLIERLNLFIESEKTGKNDDAYKMIAEKFKRRIAGGFPKKDYMESPKVKEFVPQQVDFDKDTYSVNITGCGRFKDSGGTLLTMIEAYWESGDWKFSSMERLGLDSDIKCDYKIKQ